MTMTMTMTMTRCSSCDHQQRQIRPSMPSDAYGHTHSPDLLRILIITDIPGKWDEKENRLLSGQSGKELDYTYLRLAGLRRDQIYTTSLVQCRFLQNFQDTKPPVALITTCASNHLIDEILTINPTHIILLGSIVCDYAGISKLEYEHGFPRVMENVPQFGYWSGTVVPMYSPGAGMKDSKFMIPQLQDWERLGEYLSGTWTPPTETGVSRIKHKPNYFLASTRDEVQNYFHKYTDDSWKWLAIDSESDEGVDWSIQVSIYPGTAVMVRLSDKNAVNELSMFVNLYLGSLYAYNLVFHHAPADLDLTEHVGIITSEYYDTMQELFHLGNLPQGLKPAVYRTLGLRMRSYQDVVLPYSKDVLSNWLAEALGYASTKLVEYIPHPIGKSCPTCGKTHRKDVSKAKPHECEAVLRRVLKYITENEEYDPWVKPKTNTAGETTMRLFGREWLPELERALGRMPRASIVHVPLLEARDYGCSDADHTGQLADYLAKERERIVTQEWRTT